MKRQFPPKWWMFWKTGGHRSSAMPILPFKRPAETVPVPALLDGFSIEVMPRTAEKVADFREILPKGTLVYVAHIDGTPFEDMAACVARLIDEGFDVMPHVPARSVPDLDTLTAWMSAYRDMGVTGLLVLAGGAPEQRGPFASSMDLLGTGLFETLGFTRIHVAGHPEGNKDIDPAGGTAEVDAALRWKQNWAHEAGVDMAIVTQFLFEAGPLMEWAERLRREKIDLPIHAGIAGPTKLQTLIKFSIACGVGASLKVLQKRALDLTKLLLPFEPTDMLQDLSARLQSSNARIERIHVFPLGGIKASARYATGAEAVKREAV
jgi:methylenetetrahydrofolate reductase (NADPH)